MKFFIILFERAFKMMKNGLYFIVIALLVADLFQVLIYANQISVTSQKGNKVVQNHKKLNISFDFFCIELKLSTVVMLFTKFHDMSTVTFPWQHRPSPFKGENQSFPPSRSVICSCCLFSRCERIWTLQSRSTRKSVKLWSDK